MHAARMKAPRDGIAPYSGFAYDMRHMKPAARLIQMITLGGQVGLFRLGYGMYTIDHQVGARSCGR